MAVHFHLELVVLAAIKVSSEFIELELAVHFLERRVLVEEERAVRVSMGCFKLGGFMRGYQVRAVVIEPFEVHFLVCGC